MPIAALLKQFHSLACYAPVSAPCYRQKSTRYHFLNRNRAKYSVRRHDSLCVGKAGRQALPSR
ncbi:MAG: hypothetical protein ISR72_10170 [Methylobacter sp.]|nr:hypothetical protein [Methylobacter sp.]